MTHEQAIGIGALIGMVIAGIFITLYSLVDHYYQRRRNKELSEKHNWLRNWNDPR